MEIDGWAVKATEEKLVTNLNKKNDLYPSPDQLQEDQAPSLPGLLRSEDD